MKRSWSTVRYNVLGDKSEEASVAESFRRRDKAQYQFSQVVCSSDVKGSMAGITLDGGCAASRNQRCKLQATRRVTAEKTDIELCQGPALRKVL